MHATASFFAPSPTPTQPENFQTRRQLELGPTCLVLVGWRLDPNTSKRTYSICSEMFVLLQRAKLLWKFLK